MKSKSLHLPRTDLSAYAAAMWPPFQLARHHKLIVDKLEAVERGEIDRLMIFLPPRHGKSLIDSTLFPAWYLGRHPDRSIIASSYGQELASDFGRRVRGYVTDQLHVAIFPDSRVVDDSNAVHRFGLTGGGNYYAVGAGGPITGRGADLLLIDDPIKSREDANSAAFRRSLQDWYQHVAYTRLQPGGAIVLIQTRWHQDDLTGWLLREHTSENWHIVSLPAIAEPGDALGRQEGAPLWPERFPLEVLERIREAIGSSAWLSLYQQRPTAEEGAIFKRAWFKTFSTEPEMKRVVFSLDTAFKAGTSNDYSVIAVIGESKDGYFLLHVTRERLEFPDLQRRVVGLAEIMRPNAVLIEDAASGQSLIQTLKSETRLPILPVKATGDKVSRANAVSPLVESGRVYIRDQAQWLPDFLEELCSFPAAPHDDQVDALTQALNYLRGSQVEYSWTPIPSLRSLGGSPIGDSSRELGGSERARREDAAEALQRHGGLGVLTTQRWSARHGGGW